MMAPDGFTLTGVTGYPYQTISLLASYVQSTNWPTLPFEDPRDAQARHDFSRHAPILNIAGVPPVDLDLAALDPPDEMLDNQVDAVTRAARRRMRERRPWRSRPGVRH